LFVDRCNVLVGESLLLRRGRSRANQPLVDSALGPKDLAASLFAESPPAFVAFVPRPLLPTDGNRSSLRLPLPVPGRRSSGQSQPSDAACRTQRLVGLVHYGPNSWAQLEQELGLAFSHSCSYRLSGFSSESRIESSPYSPARCAGRAQIFRFRCCRPVDAPRGVFGLVLINWREGLLEVRFVID